MELLALWCVFCVLVAVAANARGRSAVLWFLLALVISPLIAGLLVILMRNLRQERLIISSKSRRVPAPTYLNPTRTVDLDAPPKARWGGKASRVTIDRTPKPFEPDGIYAGIPYRVADDGSIDAMMQGAVVRFRDLDRFTTAVGSPPAA